MTRKVRLPKIVALEASADGIFNRQEYECGCVTVRMTKPQAPATWIYLDRCDKHGGNLLPPQPLRLADPKPDWYTR